MLPPVKQRLPYITGDLPGIGGQLRAQPDDFRVDEVPSYEPSGVGDHLFIHIEKRTLTTPQVVDQLAKTMNVRAGDIGYAGLKDRHAITSQWLSLPPPCTPEAVRTAAQSLGPDVIIRRVEHHNHKLRTGHLKGNRFRLRVRTPNFSTPNAAERATQILTRLAKPPGAPNWFGAQRFGRSGDNADIGRALLSGAPQRRAPRGRARRFYISAFQSALFNEYLAARMQAGQFATVLAGDLLRKIATGGTFTCDDVATDQARLDTGELVATGPMYGHQMRIPEENTPAGSLERTVLAKHELTLDSFRPLGKLATGTRRTNAIVPQDIEVTDIETDCIEVAFQLPKGCYATAIMREVMKPETEFPG